MRCFLFSMSLFFIAMISANAQRQCGSMEYLEQQMQENPERIKDLKKVESYTRHFEGQALERQVVTIPVVVHVVYRTSTENISDAQIQSQLDVLNDDFRRLNSDATNNWSQAADSEIEFCLATVDPNGNATTGITRTSTSVNGFGTNDSVKFTSSGGKDAWPRDSYLNFWVCNIGGGILGYAQFPGGPANTDGVVNGYQYTGTIGTASSPFDLGRTATHEVGHWLNLRHIWGDGGCGVDDFVTDTPQSDAANYGCASGHSSCGSVDMVENYMDYSDDSCMNLFTEGQKTRMQALFGPGGSRVSLLSSNGCGAGVSPTCDDGIQNGNETGVDCGGPDCAACPTCDDGVQNGDETGVDCGGSCNACPINCNDNLIMVSITLDNYPEETSWELTNASGVVVASGGTYGSQADGSTIEVPLCLIDGCYDFTINDAYGDGICCSYGNGSYSVTSNGAIIANGGSFTSSETTNICLGNSSEPTCNDGVQNGDETGVDCGGSDCAACPTCDDGVQNGDETGVDCGGSCTACATCTDGVQNGNETGIDCGGPDCAACPTCDDGVQNGDETGIDCGGSCTACATCTDGVQNGSETGIDCGGPDCAACATCDDGVQNGDETGVDCGGSCTACPSGCNDNLVTIDITFDNYPEETSWKLTNANGSTVASGGTYASEADGSTLSIEECLVDGCYDFEIFDTYGDGICCAYGNGSYTLTNGGAIIASGGSFAGSEVTNICLGSETVPTCDDGIQNGDEAGVDCGGSSCVACPTCDDGVQNGDETGVDCGGSCTPCTTGGSEELGAHYFETGWDGWSDGGSDCYRYNGANSYEGNYSIRIRDNSGVASAMTSAGYDMAGFGSVTVEFYFYPNSMESGEDFWLRYNDGSGWQTIETYTSGVNFNNDNYYSSTVTLDAANYNLVNGGQFRFQCDASANADRVYIDQVIITGNGSQSRLANSVTQLHAQSAVRLLDNDSDISISPNPADERIFVTVEENINKIMIYSITGQIVYQNTKIKGLESSIDVSSFMSGIYLIAVDTEEEVITEKFIKE